MPQQSLGMFGGTQIFTSPSPRARGFGLSMNRNSTKKKGSPPGLPFHASNYHFIYYFFFGAGICIFVLAKFSFNTVAAEAADTSRKPRKAEGQRNDTGRSGGFPEDLLSPCLAG